MVYVVFHGEASKPEVTDEVIGYFSEEFAADFYCQQKNMSAKPGWAYYWEECKNLEGGE